ncbi:MAG: type II toxin-antitoxin system RelE/ParE family toxin [Burkholderiales bacterium]|nr:type II toxin-antitoxin system RelE/ParE family toxin [Burkholderiales bacterium]
MAYQLLFFNASVQADIQDWPTQIFASFVRIAEQMEVSGPNLGLPYTKAMGGGLFEIRARGLEGIDRAFFCCVKDQKILVLHGFIKKTQTTPRRELRLAIKRMKEVKNA